MGLGWPADRNPQPLPHMHPLFSVGLGGPNRGFRLVVGLGRGPNHGFRLVVGLGGP